MAAYPVGRSVFACFPHLPRAALLVLLTLGPGIATRLATTGVDNKRGNQQTRSPIRSLYTPSAACCCVNVSRGVLQKDPQRLLSRCWRARTCAQLVQPSGDAPAELCKTLLRSRDCI